MKTLYFILLSAVTLGKQAHAVSLSELNEILRVKGVNNTVQVIHELSQQHTEKAHLSLDDELRQMGTEALISPPSLWKLDKLTQGKGIQLSLKTGHYYFKKSPVQSLELTSCPTSGASSGTAFRKNNNGSVFSYTWSCGSMGCSYQIQLGIHYSPCS